MPRTARLVEVAISVIASIATSAIVVTWKLSATLTGFEASIAEANRRMNAYELQVQSNRSAITASEVVNAKQEAAIAVSDAKYTEVIRRLDSMDSKLDKLTERTR